MSFVKVALPALAALASSAALVAACSSDATTTAPQVDASVEAGPVGCPPGFTSCNGACFNVNKDPDNCGKCGAACKAGEVCSAGVCAPTCGGGTTKCGSTCIDTKVDVENCGACAGKCAPGELCSGGKCATTCQAPYATCGGADGGGGTAYCADLQSSDTDCGQCGNACASGYVCRMGKCTSTCGANLSKCPVDGGDRCVDTTNDPANCGACGTACKGNESCVPQDAGPSKCQLGCGPGTTACGQVCADLQLDPVNCGGCGVPCNGTCYGGHCCPGNQIYCGGKCIDDQTDPNNCGGCAIACVATPDAGPTCTAGQCACAVPAQGACPGDLCAAQAATPYSNGCDPSGCVDKVCTNDSFCCSVNWDSVCVGEVDTYCSPLKCVCP